MTIDATPPPFALGALAALRRARLRAIEIARATNTCLVEQSNGERSPDAGPARRDGSPCRPRIPGETSAIPALGDRRRIFLPAARIVGADHRGLHPWAPFATALAATRPKSPRPRGRAATRSRPALQVARGGSGSVRAQCLRENSMRCWLRSAQR